VENKSKEQLKELQHLCLDIGRAYVLFTSLKIHSDDLRDTMADYISWLRLCDEQAKHNAEPNKLDHLNEWMEKSKEICNKKNKYMQRVIVFLQSAMAIPSHADYILTQIFGENYQKGSGSVPNW